ncbi:MAG: DNA N-6-adenine-methyltransferase [Isosphaeraceae bacterium]
MSKLPTVFGLGSSLRAARIAVGKTQGALALEVGLTAKTIRLLEQGSGNLTTWNAVLKHLKLEVAGRNLPAGRTLGTKIASLRKGRGLSQRDLATMVGVTQPTIVALERRGRGRLATMDRTLTVLGAGAYLASRGRAKPFYTHAGNSSTNQMWETPPELLRTLHAVFGRFDLDPCAPRRSRTRVKAKVHLTDADDGLAVPWHGVVFVNPPYGRTLAAWVAKAHREVREERARTVVALLPARPDTAYWHADVVGHAAIYFLRGRLRFGDGKQSAPFPSALAIWGATSEMLINLDAALPEAWRTR